MFETPFSPAQPHLSQGSGEHFRRGGALLRRAQSDLRDVLRAAGLFAPARRGGDHVDALSEAPGRSGLAARSLPGRRNAVRFGAGRDGRRVPRGLQGRDAADRGGHHRGVRGSGETARE